jgi:hypothetical protein
MKTRVLYTTNCNAKDPSDHFEVILYSSNNDWSVETTNAINLDKDDMTEEDARSYYLKIAA